MNTPEHQVTIRMPITYYGIINTVPVRNDVDSIPPSPIVDDEAQAVQQEQVHAIQPMVPPRAPAQQQPRVMRPVNPAPQDLTTQAYFANRFAAFGLP